MALCLHGMGGIGKSFLGLKIFTEFQKSKYRACRVELQHESKQEKLWEIQNQILDKVGNHSTSKFSNVTDGRQNMEKELNQINDPIFLYVDNVIEPEILPELLPKATNSPKGSRILITSRGKHIEHGAGIVELGIKREAYNLMEVEQLQEQQPQQLLWKQLESKGEHKDISEVESLEESVLALCGGLPLALMVVGKYIAHENGLSNAKVWHEVVHAMQNAEPLDGLLEDKLYYRIMFSTQNLAPNVKRAFLDTITCAASASSTYTLTWENTERLVSNKFLKVLCQRGLVRTNAVHGWIFKYNSPEIHDVIKAMGRRMVENDEQELRITGMNKFEEHNNALKKVVALDHVTVDAYLLKQMPLLRLLKNVDVRGECQESQLRHLTVASDLRCSTTKIFDWSECGSLKAVEWGEPNNDDAAPNVSNLEVFNHDKISMGLEALTLYNWSQLKDVDVIETLTCLKELRFCNCREIESLPEGISRLTGLNQLYLGGCKKLKGLPQGISRLICLEVFNLSKCESVQSLPEGIGNLRAVTELSLAACYKIKHLPEGVTRLTDLKKLDLSYCFNLRSLPEGVSGLTGLTSLVLLRCEKLQALPEGIARSSSLIELNFNYCMALQSLPKDRSYLTRLTELSLQGCRGLQLALTEKLGFMTGLSQLNLSRCESLQFLPDEISKLTGLVRLDLWGCKSLRSIEGVTTLMALRILDVRNCTQLQLLPEGCTGLTTLRHIYLSGCTSLQSIPEASLVHLTGLHRPPANSIQEEEKEEEEEEVNCLNLTQCESLKSLPQSIGSCIHLKRLDLENCTSLESLPDGVTRLSNLATLMLLGCKSLQCLPRGLIGSLTGLTELNLGDCAMLNIQPLLEEVSCNLTNLKVLELSGAEDLQSLPQGITSLMSLESLNLRRCSNLQSLPQGMANWTGLTRLMLLGCRSLQSLPEELTTMTTLSVLKLARCACLRSLPQGIFTSLGGLKYLSMSDCGGLTLEESQGITRLTGLRRLHLSNSEHLLFLLSEQQGLASLTCLEELYLSRCRSLQSLPEGVGALTHLGRIKLSGCASLQSLSNLPQGNLSWLHLGGFGSLIEAQPSVWESLKYLNLSGWETMQFLPEGIFASLQSLTALDLSKCSSLLSLPESFTKLTTLTKLSLQECKSLQRLPPEITRLVALDWLDLSGCTSLEPMNEDISMWTSGIWDYQPQ